MAEEPPLPVAGQERPAAAPPPGLASDATRVDALEFRVRTTMDRVAELLEAQLPEAVDGLRADLETLRLELQTSLTYASEQLADERRQLRAEIAATVGAANRWFVRTRDQLYERLDTIADAAVAAAVRTDVPSIGPAPAMPVAEIAPELPTGPEEDEQAPPSLRELEAGFEWDVEAGASAAEAAEAAEAEAAEAAEAAAAMAVDRALDAPALEAVVAPLRADIQELQGEMAAIGLALRLMHEEIERLRHRIPARPRPVRLDTEDIELIVAAVLMASPPPPPRARTVRTAAASTATRPTRAARATAATKTAKSTRAAQATKATKATKAVKAAKKPTATRSSRL